VNSLPAFAHRQQNDLVLGVGFGPTPLSLFCRLDHFKLLRGFDESSRLVELHSQFDPGHLKGEKRIAVFWRACEPCKPTLRMFAAWHSLESPPVVLVPKLDGIREVELVPCSHKALVNETGTSSRAR
jgi:hypothetical protein